MSGGDASRAEKRTSRREMLRKSAALGTAGGVVWAAPRIEGLSLRPDYAAAQSVAEGPCAGKCFDVTIPVIRRTFFGDPSSSGRREIVSLDGDATCVQGAAAGLFRDFACESLSSGVFAVAFFGPGFSTEFVNGPAVTEADRCTLDVTVSPADLGIGPFNAPTNEPATLGLGRAIGVGALLSSGLEDRCKRDDVTWTVRARLCCD